MDSCSLFLFLSTFFGGYDLSIQNSYNVPLGVVEKILDFMDSCSLFLFLLTFLGGYDLYIISTEYYPLKLERATGPKGRSCESNI